MKRTDNTTSTTGKHDWEAPLPDSALLGLRIFFVIITMKIPWHRSCFLYIIVNDMTIDFPSITNFHHVRHVSPCVRLHVGGFLDLSGSEGRSAMAPMSRLHRIRGASLPLSSAFFFSHFSRRYVSHPSTRPLTLRWPDGITIPGLSRDVAAVPDLGEQRSTRRFLSSETSDALTRARLRYHRDPYRQSWRCHPRTPIEIQENVQVLTSAWCDHDCGGDHATMRRQEVAFLFLRYTSFRLASLSYDCQVSHFSVC